MTVADDLKGFTAVLLAALFLCGCSEGTCVSHTSRVCAEGNIYWMDACGNYQELVEECRCGCKTVAAECKRCDDCTCSEENTCCDGCLAQNDGELCDDGDPGTRLDHCGDGLCSGWRFTIAEPAVPAEPAAPEPVRLQSWSCPPGWSQETHASLLDEAGRPFSWCRPPPLPRLKTGEYITPLKEGELDGDRPVCEPDIDGTFPLLGHADCQPLGDPCPAGEWPEIPPEVSGTRIYVRAGATGGDGTPTAPLGSVPEAVAAAAAGDVVVIGAGSYTGVVEIDKDLTLWGACVRQTIITAPDPGTGYNFGAVWVSGPANVTLRNLRVGGDQYGVRVANSGASVRVEGVWIHQAAAQAVLVDTGSVQLIRVLVDSTRTTSAGQLGTGLTVKGGADCQVRSSTIEANRYTGVQAYNSQTALLMQDVAVRNTLGNATSPDVGWGLQVKTGANAEVARALFDHNLQTGVYATSSGTGLLLEDAVIADTLCDTGGNYGDGLWVQAGARGRMIRGRLSSNHHIGAIVVGTGANLEIEDSVVFDTLVDEETGEWGVGILAEEAALRVLRTVVEGNCPVGILAQFENTSASLEDVVIRRTRYKENNLAGGWGLFATEGAILDVTRGMLEENYDVAVYVSGTGTRATFEDVTVQDTESEEDSGDFGLGMLVDLGAQAFVTRGFFARNRSEGIRAMNPDTWLQLQDVEIRETRGRASDNKQGMGLWITEGAGAEVNRALLEQNTYTGVLVTEPGTSLSIEDVTVKDTRSSQDNHTGGEGLWIGWGASASLSRGWFENNRYVGIYCGMTGSQLTAEDVTVLSTLGQESDGDNGFGMAAADGGRIVLQRGRLEDNHSAGIGAGHPGTSISLGDVIVRGTRSREWDLWMGRGMEVNLGAEATVTNGLFETNRDLGIIAFSPGTRVTLSQVIIRDTLQRECAGGAGPYPCEGFGHGTGLGAFDQAQVLLEGAEIETSQLAGLQLATQATAAGLGLALRGNPVGVNVQSTPEGYDFFDSVKGLLMEDNQTNFDTTELPIPDLLDIGQ